MSFLEFFRRNSGQILTLAIEHLWLVGVSVFLAVLIGVPLGVLLTRYPGPGGLWKKVVLGFANIVQTIPSLALLGFLLVITVRLALPVTHFA